MLYTSGHETHPGSAHRRTPIDEGTDSATQTMKTFLTLLAGLYLLTSCGMMVFAVWAKSQGAKVTINIPTYHLIMLLSALAFIICRLLGRI